MALVEVYLCLGPALLPPTIQIILVDHHFYSYGDNRSGHMYHTRQFYAYNHGGLNIYGQQFSSRSYSKGCSWIKYTSKSSLLLLSKHGNTPSSKHATTSSSQHTISYLSKNYTKLSLFVFIFYFYSYVCTVYSSTLTPYTIIGLSTYII